MTGSGVLATVYFRLKTNDDFEKITPLRLTDVKAVNSTGELEVFIDEGAFALSQQ